MRIPESVLKSVVFIGYRYSSGADGTEDIDLDATAFYVSYPSTVKGYRYFYFVTAKHAIRGNHGGEPGFVLNTSNGREFRPMQSGWYTHPDDTIDVAITPFAHEPVFDIIHVPLEGFIDPKVLEFPTGAYGIGSDVFFPGLFVFASGDKRAMPVMRRGNLAMIPDGPIQSYTGVSEMYLIEARSIGGVSGSPVFIRPLIDYPLRVNPNNAEVIGLIQMAEPCALLGMIGGHYDIEGDINKYQLTLAKKKEGVNMGLAFVVPARQIREVLEHPRLVESRQANDEKLRISMITTPD